MVAAHPDDDVLGCGASLARWAGEGASIRVLSLADGVTSRREQPEGIAERKSAAARALGVLGVTDHQFLDFPDQRLDTIPLVDLATPIADEIALFAPNLVLTHSPKDLNVDHRLAGEATLIACRPQPGSPVRRLLHFEVPSATGWRFHDQHFMPSFWVDVSDTERAKLDALACFGPEMRPWPHVRSLEAIQALLRWRGASVGVPAAEAFEVSFWVQD